MTTDLAIDATALEKSYGGTRVLAGIDVRVPRGTVYSLLGPNGAGKTTTVRILATLTGLDGGTARVAGFDVAGQQHQVRRSISLTGQYAAVDELQTGEENLRMMGRLFRLGGAQSRRRAAELLERFDLADAANRRVATYSGGMRRRLDLAAGLVGRPSVVFLDEPTTGLDPGGRQAMWDVITELTGSGVTVLLTTQYLEEADRLADRIALIDGGRVVAEGTPAELKQRVAEQRLDLTFADASGLAAALSLLGERAIVTGNTLGIATDGTAAHIRAVLDELDPGRTAIARFTVHTATLDDVFLALTGRVTPHTERESVHV